ncbi:MAG: hypothetical protein AVDCRST_MAG56-5621 [uncultured Cytophagales bacterium]|uniref:Uncharacterized protein n=1 Tax=uncultured Cytophagales bacterium TaxID=158755 RepID=A0A6J4KE50_9SPHI|nr:MAG: hypothetical protein AVDCRST_MAG56-5621 [uncultured Cytophagales bacterium]
MNEARLQTQPGFFVGGSAKKRRLDTHTAGGVTKKKGRFDESLPAK